MKYFEIEFCISGPQEALQDARDLLAAITGEAGLETFEYTAEGMRGYVQQSLFDNDALQQAVKSFPMEQMHITYEIREAEDRDWNEQWEQEGFQPIVIADRIIIHDGRHLPESFSAPHACQAQANAIFIEIDARLAFGTGTHETTHMVVSRLLELNLTGQRILDCGSGTGILGIAAMKLGARECVAFDIDEWSVENTRHNAVINNVEITPLLGNISVISPMMGKFDVITANINRNILLSDMTHFYEKLSEHGMLVLSGFYTDDIPILVQSAQQLDMRLKDSCSFHEWACLTFSKS